MNPVSKDQIIGTYAYSIPKVGFIMAKMNHKILMAIAVWIVLINAAAILITHLLESDEEEEENNKKDENIEDEKVEKPGQAKNKHNEENMTDGGK